MKRLAVVRWRSAPPTSVDEELAVFDDGTAWLVVRSPRALSGPIGTWVTRPSTDDHATLTAAGPGPITIDVVRGMDDAVIGALGEVAGRIAALARNTPRAVATFAANALASAGSGPRSLALTVAGSGTEPVELELDPDRCTVHFSAAGRPVGWFPLPDLGSGFVTSDFEGLGGLRMPTSVPPGAFGATAFELAVPANATAVAIEVVGLLTTGLPDDSRPALFRTRTDDAPLA